MTSQDKLGVSYIQLNNGLINCTHVGRFSHLPQSVNHYLILNVTVSCVLELQLWFRQVLVTYSQVESSIRTSSCGFELLVAIKAILHHCNYYLDYFFWLMKAFTAASLLHCFILQWLSKLWDLLCELCVCLQIYMLKFNMVSEPRWTRHFSSSDLLLDHFFCFAGTTSKWFHLWWDKV